MILMPIYYLNPPGDYGHSSPNVGTHFVYHAWRMFTKAMTVQEVNVWPS